jgi:hypothetical protein
VRKMSDQYSKWTVNLLKVELSKRGARVTGRKHELIERLEAYDRNDDFCANTLEITEATPMPSWPVITEFRTITMADRDLLPAVTLPHIQLYVLHHQKVRSGDASADVSAMKKGDRMAKEAVLALSFFQPKSPATASAARTTSVDMAASETAAAATDSAAGMASAAAMDTSTTASTASTAMATSETMPVFFSGIVGAEMKKNTSYNLKLVLQQTGEISHSHCECAVGKGPHSTCKHVVSVCRLLAHFRDTGEFLVAKSCTDELQMFKKPVKLHSGSPKRAEDIGRGVPKKDDDPRPLKYR